MSESRSDHEEEVPTIVATTQQTRFYLVDGPGSFKVDVRGLNITIVPPSTSQGTGASDGKKSKAKAAGSHGLELLSSADLKLKTGVCYGLLGRNGTGKSTLLRALAEKLIPGLSLSMRICILQQSEKDAPVAENDKTVLQYVVESNELRNDVIREINVLSNGMDDSEDPLVQIRAYRQLQYERLSRELLEVERNARLRSGARGFQARKDLISFQKKVEESKKRIEQDIESTETPEVQEEIQAASNLLADLENQLESMKLSDVEAKARDVLRGLGFKDASFEKPLSTLSGGWNMRCTLASVLIQESDIMILDEPTNFLDLLGIVWLQSYLMDLRASGEKTVVLVSHDRDFIKNVCEEIIILKDQGLTYFRGNLSEYEEEFQSRKLYLTRMQEAQDRQEKHMEKTISTNIKQGKKTGDENKLRQAKSRQKKLDDRSGMQVSATGGRFKLSRDRAGFHHTSRGEIEIPKDEKATTMTLPTAPDLRFPGPLISLEKISFRYKPKGVDVLQEVDLTIHMGDRVGIVGLNGCGKSTLINIVTDLSKPTKGSVTRHSRLRLGYYSQRAVEDLKQLGTLEPSRTALSTISADAGDEMLESDVRGLLGSLGLPGRTASDVPIAKLSGGQLVRLALARILWSHPQLLVLDEVTTHLDFHTVIALSEALAEFNGALLVVSHDRFFIQRVVEGEVPEGSDDEDERHSGKVSQEEKYHRRVFLLKQGKLKLQSNGVKDFESSLEKRIAKLSM